MIRGDASSCCSACRPPPYTRRHDGDRTARERLAIVEHRREASSTAQSRAEQSRGRNSVQNIPADVVHGSGKVNNVDKRLCARVVMAKRRSGWTTGAQAKSDRLSMIDVKTIPSR